MLASQSGFMQHMDHQMEELHSKLEKCLLSQGKREADLELRVEESEAELGDLSLDASRMHEDA